MLVTIILLIWCLPNFRPIVNEVLAEAFLQVSAFVAMTLCVYYSVTHYLNTKPLQNWVAITPSRSVYLAAIMGVLPGCGGAILVITQYTQGKTNFGAVIAVLTSTMGDAAFLLISQKPQDALIVLCISFFVGIIAGLITQHYLPHPRLPLAKKPPSTDQQTSSYGVKFNQAIDFFSLSFWGLVLVPASIIAILFALQIDTDHFFSLPAQTTELLGVCGGVLSIILWALSAKTGKYSELAKEDSNPPPYNWLRKVAQDTQFVTTWVVVAFLLFELGLAFFGEGALEEIKHWGSTSILLATLVGLLPGCGPQIMVTGLYLQGSIPLSAQIANSISNDGDALFPAIALAPKAALIATLYSSVPALVAGYTYYILIE
ncbi:putative manganese transporter [Marinomonas epiphytica]